MFVFCKRSPRRTRAYPPLLNKGCSVCQACNSDNPIIKGEAQWTPIPDQPMESVAMNVFSMREVHIGKEVVNYEFLCVDRHSGYIVAIRTRKSGLLAKEVAVMMICHWLTVFGVLRTNCSSLAAGSRQCVPSWGYSMPRVTPISAGPMAELKCLEGSCLRRCARSASPTSAVTDLRRCCQLLRPIMTAPHRVACHGNTFFSAGTPWVGDVPCQVMAWQWMETSPLRGKRLRRRRCASSSRRSTQCQPRPPQSPQRISSGG